MKMKRFLLYAHPGSYNHGAEAIASTTISIIREKYGKEAHIAVSSHFPEQDLELKLDADVLFSVNNQAWDEERQASSWEEKRSAARKMYSDALLSVTPDTVLISVGGDNFCYNNWYRLEVFQEVAVQKGAKSILWGCSIEPSAITPKMVGVLSSYTHILPRETKTLKALRDSGVSANIHLLPDPAFGLEPEGFEFPKGEEFADGRAVGINVGPLITRKEKVAGIIKKNILNLIDYVLLETNKSIMLIPHVVMPVDNDLETLAEIAEYVPPNLRSRVWLVDNKLSAAQRKFAISKCGFLICARFHASVAAYSTGVPTIVLGKTNKSTGIAQDLGVGQFVIDIKEIEEPYVVKTTFKVLEANEKEVRLNLTEKAREWKKQTSEYLNFI